MKLSAVLLVLTGLVVALAEPRVPQRGAIHEISAGVAGPNPYVFLTVPRGRSQSLVQGFEVMEDDDDDDDEVNEALNMKYRNSMAQNMNDDDDDDESADDDEDVVEEPHDDDDEEEEEDDMSVDVMKGSAVAANAGMLKKTQKPLKNAKNTQMMVSRDHAGAIMVPDGVIEIEGQSVIDEKTGKPALLLPRAILDSIPDGSVVALLERPTEGRSVEEERANRVIVRRRRKGSRRNIKRRRGGNGRRRRRGGNRRRVNRRRNVRVVRVGGNGNRRRNVRRGNRRVVYAG